MRTKAMSPGDSWSPGLKVLPEFMILDHLHHSPELRILLNGAVAPARQARVIAQDQNEANQTSHPSEEPGRQHRPRRASLRHWIYAVSPVFCRTQCESAANPCDEIVFILGRAKRVDRTDFCGKGDGGLLAERERAVLAGDPARLIQLVVDCACLPRGARPPVGSRSSASMDSMCPGVRTMTTRSGVAYLIGRPLRPSLIRPTSRLELIENHGDVGRRQAGSGDR